MHSTAVCTQHGIVKRRTFQFYIAMHRWIGEYVSTESILCVPYGTSQIAALVFGVQTIVGMHKCVRYSQGTVSCCNAIVHHCHFLRRDKQSFVFIQFTVWIRLWNTFYWIVKFRHLEIVSHLDCIVMWKCLNWTLDFHHFAK